MKEAVAIVCLLGAMVSACADGSAGNPNGDAYAGMPGGAIAVRPQAMGIVTYDPGAPQKVSTGLSITGTSGDRGGPACPSTAAQVGGPDVAQTSR